MSHLELGSALGSSDPVDIKNEGIKTEIIVPINQDQHATQQMAMPVSASCSAASAAVCQKCRSSKSTLGPLDDRVGESRAWGTGDLCHWCEEVEGIEAKDPTSFQDEGSDVLSQPVKLQAYFSLVMEGHINITPTALKARMVVLRAVMACSTPASSSSRSTGASSSKDSLPPKLSRPMSLESIDFAEEATSHSHGTSPAGVCEEGHSPPPDSAGAARSPAPAGPPPQPPSRPVAPSAQSASLHIEGEVGVDEYAINEWSLDGKLPSGVLGNSIGRMRSTINNYVERMVQNGWVASFRTPTIKALQRRLENSTTAVSQSLHVELIDGHHQLTTRLVALLLLHKNLNSWCVNFNDKLLEECLSPRNIFVTYLDRMDLRLAPDLEIMFIRASFASELMQQDSLSKALKTISKMELLDSYLRLNDPKLAAPPDVKQKPTEPKVEEEIVDPGADDESQSRKGSTRKKQKRGGYDKSMELIVPEGPLQFVILIMDKALQLKMYSMHCSESLKDRVSNFIDDLTVADDLWMSEWAMEDGANAFGNLLKAIKVVFQCLGDWAHSRPKPSDVRVARKTIQQAAMPAEGRPPMKSALCLSHYNVPKQAMEASRLVASASLRDEGADEEFESLFKTMEDDLQLAFQSFLKFFNHDCNGQPHTMHSFTHKMRKTMAWSTQLLSLADAWSDARLEDRCEDIETLLSYVSTVLGFAVAFCVRDFSDLFCTNSTLLGPRVDEEASATPVADDVAQDQGEQSMDVVDDHGGSNIEEANLASDLVNAAPNLASLALLCKEKEKDFATFMSEVVVRAQGAKVVVDTFMQRRGDWVKNTSMVDSINATISLAERVRDLVLSSHTYIYDMAFLSDKAPPSEVALAGLTSNSGSTEKPYMDALTRFCAFHGELVEGSILNFVWKDGFVDIMESTNLTSKLHRLHLHIGTMTYDVHVNTCLASCIQALEASVIKASVVEVSTMANTSLKDCFVFLIQEPSVGELAKVASGISADQSLPDEALCSHDLLLKSLEAFVQSTSIESVKLSGLRKAGTDGTDMVPWDEAHLFLKTMGKVRSVAAIAARLHLEHIVAQIGSPNVPESSSLGEMACLLVALGNALTELDMILHDPQAAQMEGQGWQSDSSFTLLRHWQMSMAAFRSKIITHWLEKWVMKLVFVSKKVKSDAPTWEPCMRDDILNRQLASSSIKGKLGRVVSGHNEMHALLATFRDSAEQVGIVPRLADHPVTQSSIAECLHLLTILKTSLTVVQGLDILANFNEHHLGPAKAKKFLDENPEEQRSDSVPKVFLDRA